MMIECGGPGVHPNTAFRWRHRFLSLPKEQQANHLAGIAEVDETYFLESQKGRKQSLGRAPRKRGGKASKRGLSDEQTAVLICRDRTYAVPGGLAQRAISGKTGSMKPTLWQTKNRGNLSSDMTSALFRLQDV